MLGELVARGAPTHAKLSLKSRPHSLLPLWHFDPGTLSASLGPWGAAQKLLTMRSFFFHQSRVGASFSQERLNKAATKVGHDFFFAPRALQTSALCLSRRSSALASPTAAMLAQLWSSLATMTLARLCKFDKKLHCKELTCWKQAKCSNSTPGSLRVCSHGAGCATWAMITSDISSTITATDGASAWWAKPLHAATHTSQQLLLSTCTSTNDGDAVVA